MAEIRINATGGVKLYDADDSHYAQIVAGTITSNTDVMTLGHAAVVMGTKLDMNGSNLVLDADADTYLDTGTDDTIKFYVSGAHDLTIGANAINVLSGTTLTIDSGATITNSGTANGFGSADPSSADGDTLGTASAEWSDLYLADGGVIYFGNDQEITLTHNADDGLLLKHVGTGDGKEPSLTFQAGDNDIAQDDVLGSIFFQAPDEGAGTDAVLVAAGIEAVSEGDFSSSNNATKLSFKTAASEAAAEKMSLSSAGLLTVTGGVTMTGATPTLTIGDAGAEDTKIVFDGNAQDFHIGLDDSSDDLVIGVGSTLGTTTAIAIDENLVTTFGGDVSLSNDTAGNILTLEHTGGSNTGNTFIEWKTGGASSGLLGKTSASDERFELWNKSNDYMSFGTNNTEAMRIDNSGDLIIGKTSQTFSTAGTEIYANGDTRFTADANSVMKVNRTGSDGYIFSVYNDGSFEGGLTFSGGTITYQTFVGSHWTRLADNSKPTILRGTVMESIATMCNWYEAVAEVAESTDSDGNVTPAHKVKECITLPNGKSAGDAVTFTSDEKEYTGVYVKENNQQLPMSKVSDTEDSKAVYGVFMDWDDKDDGLNGDVNDIHIASVGAYVVRIHKDETVAIGDYLQSKGDGTAKVQADDIMRASTIAKVTSTTKTHIHADDSYCVPCTLHCG